MNMYSRTELSMQLHATADLTPEEQLPIRIMQVTGLELEPIWMLWKKRFLPMVGIIPRPSSAWYTARAVVKLRKRQSCPCA
jgi:hypothetical protein